MKKWIISCLAFVGFMSPAFAQQETNTSLNYVVAFPASDLKDYAGNTSFRGLEFSYHYLLTSNVGLGLNAGMNIFYERESGTFSEGTTSITGTQFRYANSFPILFTASYYLKPEQPLNPYVNFGIGTLYTIQQTDIGVFRTGLESWQLNLKPEVGLIYQLNPGLGIKLSGKYYQAFKTDELEAQSFGAIGIGVVFSGDRRY